jgi:hypothetical protein
MSGSNSGNDDAQGASSSTLRASLGGGPQRVARGEQQSDISSTAPSELNNAGSIAMDMAQMVMDLRAKYPDIPYETLLEIAKDSMSRAKETVSKSSTPSKGAENFEWTRHEGNVWPQSDRDTDTQDVHLTPNEAETRRLSQNVFSSQGAPRKNDERTYLSISNMDWKDSLAFHLQKSKTETRISNMNAHDIFVLQKKWEEYVKQRDIQRLQIVVTSEHRHRRGNNNTAPEQGRYNPRYSSNAKTSNSWQRTYTSLHHLSRHDQRERDEYEHHHPPSSLPRVGIGGGHPAKRKCRQRHQLKRLAG